MPYNFHGIIILYAKFLTIKHYLSGQCAVTLQLSLVLLNKNSKNMVCIYKLSDIFINKFGLLFYLTVFILVNSMKAPKKKSKGSKGGRTSAGIVDGVSMAEMSREQLEGFSARMKKELEREREERNFFQLERDKVLTFWEITRHELEENRASLRYLYTITRINT